MIAADVVLKGLVPVRVAELTGIAASYGPDDIGPVIQPLYLELSRRLRAAGLKPGGPEIAYYEPVPAGHGQVVVHAAVPVVARPRAAHEVMVVDLPRVCCAATILHRGAMDDVTRSLWALASWIDDHGYRMAAFHREVYIDYRPDHPHDGLTELQLPVSRRWRWLAREMNGGRGLLACLRG